MISLSIPIVSCRLIRTAFNLSALYKQSKRVHPHVYLPTSYHLSPLPAVPPPPHPHLTHTHIT